MTVLELYKQLLNYPELLYLLIAIVFLEGLDLAIKREKKSKRKKNNNNKDAHR